MARPTKLTPELTGQIENLLGIGCTVEVTCSAVGIGQSTFYQWKQQSARLRELAEAGENARAVIAGEDLPLLEFAEALTRAQARAHVVATMAVHSALVEHRYTESVPYMYSETRLRKGRDGEEIHYVYQEIRLRTVEHLIPPDWRAGVEFLKRRDPAAWNPPQKVEISFEEQAIKYIRAGEVEFWAMVEEFDDYDLVADLFQRAGQTLPKRDDRHEEEL